MARGGNGTSRAALGNTRPIHRSRGFLGHGAKRWICQPPAALPKLVKKAKAAAAGAPYGALAA